MMDTSPLSKEQIEILIEAGARAPSGGNMQPWIVATHAYGIRVSLDEKRSCASWFLDVDRYASIFALGCFVENVSLKASSLGLRSDVRVKEGKETKDFSCEVVFHHTGSPSDQVLADTIPIRTTNRRFFDGTLIAGELLQKLQSVLQKEKVPVLLHTIYEETDKKTLARMLADADGIRMTKEEPFSQMMHEFRWSKDEVVQTKDGLDLATLELPGNAEQMLRLLRSFQFTRKMLPRQALGDFTKPLLLGCSHLCCLAVDAPVTQSSIFAAGRQAERVWLKATALGLAFHPWTTLVFFLLRLKLLHGEGFSLSEKKELASLDGKFREVFGLEQSETPVFLFRLSYANPPTARALRLPVNAFTTFAKE